MAQAATTLSAAIAAAGTLSCTVRDVVGFATAAETSDLVQIDSEYIGVTAGMGTTSWTITRGLYGSTAVSHLDAAPVYRLEQKYTDASRLQVMSKAASAEYAFLRDCADQANSWLTAEVGIFYGPSTDATRTYDVDRDSDELLIPGGLRSFSAVEMKLMTGGSFINITADVVARPSAWERIDGLEADRLVIKNITTLGYRYFKYGLDVVRVTGVFGPAVPPMALRRIADTLGWELYQSRAAGSMGVVGAEDMMMVTRRVLTPADYSTILLYRGVNQMYAYPGRVMAAATNVPQFTLSIYADPRSLARVNKRLDKWQGKELEARLTKATGGAMSLAVGPLRAAAPVSPHGQTGKYPHAPGNLRKKIRAKALRKRAGEVAAAYAGTSNYYGLWVQQGTSEGQKPNPFVAQVLNQIEPQISAFVDEQVRRLA